MSTGAAAPWLTVLVGSLVCLVVDEFVARTANGWAKPHGPRAGLARTVQLHAAASASAAAVVTAVGGCWLLGRSWFSVLGRTLTSAWQLTLVPAGLLVGVGEFAVAALLATVAVEIAPLTGQLTRTWWPLNARTAPAAAGGGGPSRLAAPSARPGTAQLDGSTWLLLTRDAWGLRWRDLVRVEGPCRAGGLLLLLCAAEELLWRGPLLSLGPAHSLWSVAPAFLTLAVQLRMWRTVGRPSVRTIALALAVLVNTALAVSTGSLLPGMAASFSFVVVSGW